MYKNQPDLDKIRSVLSNEGEVTLNQRDGANEIAMDIDIASPADNRIFSDQICSFDDQERTEEDLIEVTNRLGFTPKFQICFQASTNSDFCHGNIKNLILKTLPLQEAYIDFNAAYEPELNRSREKIRENLNGINGKVWELNYETSSGETWFTHAMDFEFFKNLTNTPNFRFPK